MQKHSIAKNFLYNTIFKVFQLITPIVTVPYVARVLGSDGVGTYAFTNAILGYFMLFGALGISTYGNRSIAYVREDLEERSSVFWEIFFTKAITATLALVGFIGFVFLFGEKYRDIYLMQTLMIMSVIFDISWFFAGLEDFKKIVTRDMAIRIVSIIMIFTFVKTSHDINLYALILSGASFLSSLTMWYYIRDKIIFKKTSIKNVLFHLKPLLVFFIPFVAAQVYNLSDRIILGIFTNASEIGYYEMAQKIVVLASTATMTLGAVMMPRMAHLFARDEHDAIKHYIGKSFRFLNFLSIPMVLGIIAISKDFVPWFLGPDFAQVPVILSISAFLIFLNGWGNSLGVQILVPMGKEKIIALNGIAGAVISLCLNLILIPHFQATGAAISAVSTAFILRLNYIWILRKFLPFKEIFGEFWKYMFAGIIMFGLVNYMGMFMPATVLTTFIQLSVGFMVYFFITFILKCEMNRFLIGKSVQLLGVKRKNEKFNLNNRSV